MAVGPVKTGLRNYLRTSDGLRPADSVTVRSAVIAPDEFNPAADTIVLGNVSTSQDQAGLMGRSETTTLTCWVIVTRAGGDETAVETVRDRAEAIMALVEDALDANPSAGGAVPAPGQIGVATSSLEESPADLEGMALRRAELQFTLSWTSHQV